MFWILIAVIVLGFVAVCVQIAAVGGSIQQQLALLQVGLDTNLEEIKDRMPPALDDGEDS